ncbi:MAG TPA: hypothetical protein VKP64_09250 [Mycobacteriales bacterium]|nr:hypothetical protein [Mycobacteriales bacterium]
MLSIGKLAGGQEGYYLQAVARGVEDYYLGSGRRRATGSHRLQRLCVWRGGWTRRRCGRCWTPGTPRVRNGP